MKFSQCWFLNVRPEKYYPGRKSIPSRINNISLDVTHTLCEFLEPLSFRGRKKIATKTLKHKVSQRYLYHYWFNNPGSEPNILHCRKPRQLQSAELGTDVCFYHCLFFQPTSLRIFQNESYRFFSGVPSRIQIPVL